MNLTALRGFSEIANRGSLASAAKAMNISEPALSRQIANLEYELGLTLFSREKRQLEITEEGEAFLGKAQTILQSLIQMPQIVQDIKANFQERINVISMPRLTTTITAPALALFRKEEPGIMVNLEIQPRLYLERWVAVNRFDVGVGALPPNHDAVETETTLAVDAVAVLPLDHPMADAKELQLEDILGDPFISNMDGTLIKEQTDEIFKRAGHELKPVINVSQTQFACNLVAEGVGITISDPLSVAPFAHRVKTVPIRPTSKMEFGLIWHKGKTLSKPAALLAEIIRDVSKSLTF